MAIRKLKGGQYRVLGDEQIEDVHQATLKLRI